jgi:hypothetical protein
MKHIIERYPDVSCDARHSDPVSTMRLRLFPALLGLVLACSDAFEPERDVARKADIQLATAAAPAAIILAAGDIARYGIGGDEQPPAPWTRW